MEPDALMPKAAELIVIPFFNSGLFTHRSQLFAPYRSLGVNIVSYHDSLLDGQDMELISTLQWRRRPGFPRYCSQAFAANEIPLQFYGARSPSGTCLQFVDTNQNFSVFTPTSITNLVSKSTTAQGFCQQVGAMTYYSNGVDQKKWNGTTVTPWGIKAPNVAPVILSTGNAQFWQANFAIGSGGYIILDANGFFQKATSIGVTGNTTPLWNTTFGGTTVDNTTFWTNRGAYSGWTASNPYPLGTIIVDSNFNLQEVTTAGTSGTTAPAWASAIGSTTTDSGVTWTMRGVGTYAPPSSSGPKYPTAVAQTGSNDAWANLTNLETPNGMSATCSVPVGTVSNVVNVSNFGFSIPGGATIVGVKAELGRYASFASAITEMDVYLLKAGVASGLNRASSGFWPSSLSNETAGGSSDLWGNALSPADVNNAGFGLTFQVENTAFGIVTAYVDYVRLTVYYTTTSGTVLGTGQIAAQAGYVYTACYHTTDGEVSTAAPLTVSTGPILGQFINTLQLQSSGNPNCDVIQVYRNADGGALQYFLGSVANPGSGTVNFVDNTNPDVNLDPQIIAPLDHLNDPPPAGMTILVYWMGRLWGAVGNKLYFDAGPDCTNGTPESAWPPANVFQYPGPITGLSPTSQGLLVWGADYISMALGGPQTLSFYPYDLLKGVGIASPNALSQDGDTLSILTTQGRALQINLAGETEIGDYVSDQIEQIFQPATSYVATHRNGADNGFWLADGSSTLLRYGLKLQAWSTLYKPVGGMGAIRSIETSPGKYSLLAGRATGGGYILARSDGGGNPALVNRQDDGQNYSNCFVTIGNITLSQPGQKLVPLEHIVGYFDAAGTLGPLGGANQVKQANGSFPLGGPSFPSVYILPNEVSSTSGIGFQQLLAGNDSGALPEPVDGAAPSTTLLQLRWPVSQMNGLNASQLMHHLQVKFVFAPENAPNTIKAMALMFEKD
jgi:hypothetical protein